MRKVRKSLIRRRNSSAEDYEDYRKKNKEEEDEGVRPRCASKHSYLSRMRSKSDEEVFEGASDRRFVAFCCPELSAGFCGFAISFFILFLEKLFCRQYPRDDDLGGLLVTRTTP
jgi:hypothetical protein